MWTSSDGLTWGRVVDDEAAFGGDLAPSLTSVTVGGPGLVAVGVDWDREAAAAWTSTDGLDWQRVPHDEAVFGGEAGQWMHSVTEAGAGLIAVGREGLYDEGSAAVWTSPDGITWRRLAHDELALGDGAESESMASVTTGGPGLIAVGGASHWRGWQAARVWTSP